jgi:gamma-glutamyl:cysteine ligase YbdK (ATP-grasp superfamily)
MRCGRIFFNSSPNSTLGVEVELQILENETLDKLMPIAKMLECESQLDVLSEMAEKNDAPYQRQIRTYKHTNDFTDILKNAIIELKLGYEVYA